MFLLGIAINKLKAYFYNSNGISAVFVPLFAKPIAQQRVGGFWALSHPKSQIATLRSATSPTRTPLYAIEFLKTKIEEVI